MACSVGGAISAYTACPTGERAMTARKMDRAKMLRIDRETIPIIV